VKLVGQASVPDLELAQELPVPAAAANAPTLLEQGEVESHDSQGRPEKGRKPVRHEAPIVATVGARPLIRAPHPLMQAFPSRRPRR